MEGEHAIDWEYDMLGNIENRENGIKLFWLEGALKLQCILENALIPLLSKKSKEKITEVCAYRFLIHSVARYQLLIFKVGGINFQNNLLDANNFGNCECILNCVLQHF